MKATDFFKFGSGYDALSIFGIAEPASKMQVRLLEMVVREEPKALRDYVFLFATEHEFTTEELDRLNVSCKSPRFHFEKIGPEAFPSAWYPNIYVSLVDRGVSSWTEFVEHMRIVERRLRTYVRDHILV